MKIGQNHFTTIWEKNESIIQIIDQRTLPHKLVIEDLKCTHDFELAIRDMHVRGAPLIGATAAYGIYIACLEAMREEDFDTYLLRASERLKATRPTAVDLFNLIDRCLNSISKFNEKTEKTAIALEEARAIANEIKEHCNSIGHHGVSIIQSIYEQKKETVNILTHCNAGWLATIDYGTATAPIYEASKRGIPIHVWVDETRPRNQGARLTAFELGQEGIPHTIIADNTGGLLMQKQMVDLVIVGSDRTTRTGDVANKIGTYLKALAAYDNNIPFYAALPESSFDWNLSDGVNEIPIEERSAEEIHYMQGLDSNGDLQKVLICPADSPALNYGFDVTPSKYVTGIITERGVCEANESSILSLYPEKLDL
jgi:methylthioribose-1-phosphate isomerase